MAQVDFAAVDDAFRLSASRAGDGGVRLSWEIEAGYYLYRDKLAAAVAWRDGSSKLPISTAPGLAKEDPTFGPTEVYYGSADADISAADLAAAGNPQTLAVTFQGCAERGICYPPTTRTLDLATLAIVDDASAIGKAAPAGWSVAVQDSLPVDPVSVVVPAESAGLVGNLLSQGGFAWVVASFLALGLLLAFTPCVLPMYPILAGILAREGGQLSGRRGFSMASIYVLGMASAFGLLGVAAAYSGQNLQMALQSPYAIVAVSIVFLLLALSTFGLFEMRMPAAWAERLSGGRDNARRSLVSTAFLGFTSALIVGPCVTAPLAGALLYIGQTGDVRLGAAALFALGIGKGVPLVAFGTLGARALPRTGPWMTSVKFLFGILFLGAAIWMLSRVIAPSIALALWATLALLTGALLGAFDSLAPGAGPRRRARKAAGLLASLYGVVLFVGAAAGGTEPLRPLAVLRTGGAVENAAIPQFQTISGPVELAQAVGAAPVRPTFVYFSADWCISCKIIERNVFASPDVQARLRNFRMVKADVTANNAADRALMEDLQVVGPPTMLFLGPDGAEVAGTRLVGEVGKSDFLETLALAGGG